MVRTFKVLIRGSRFKLSLDGAPGLYGFYTHRFVGAKTEEDARQSAIRLVEMEIGEMVTDGPIGEFVVEEVVETGWLWNRVAQGKGFTFFPEDPQG
jgi:hypothetical protein